MCSGKAVSRRRAKTGKYLTARRLCAKLCGDERIPGRQRHSAEREATMASVELGHWAEEGLEMQRRSSVFLPTPKG
jgi:hypothetical protein